MAQAAGAGLSLIGTIGSTVGRIQAADVEAKSLQAEARSIEEQAAFDERQQRRKARLLLGEATAQGAASGVDISSGSPLLLELDRTKQSEIEALSIRRTGRIGAEARRFGARLARRSIPYTILGAATGGTERSPGVGSILTSYIGNR